VRTEPDFAPDDDDLNGDDDEGAVPVILLMITSLDDAAVMFTHPRHTAQILAAVWPYLTFDCDHRGPYGDGTYLAPVNLRTLLGAQTAEHLVTGLLADSTASGDQ
jgi:hypothetical protein